MTITPDWAEKLARETAMSIPPSDFSSHRAIQAFAAALRAVAGPWAPLDTAPKDGTVITVRSEWSYRFQPYKKTSQEFTRGLAGRWQEHNGYGWQNCADPVGDWKPADTTAQS